MASQYTCLRSRISVIRSGRWGPNLPVQIGPHLYATSLHKIGPAALGDHKPGGYEPSHRTSDQKTSKLCVLNCNISAMGLSTFRFMVAEPCPLAAVGLKARSHSTATFSRNHDFWYATFAKAASTSTILPNTQQTAKCLTSEGISASLSILCTLL